MPLKSRVSTLACIVSFIPAVAHEATHYAAARSVTSHAGFHVELTGSQAVAQWAPIEHPVLRAWAFLAPTVFGVLLAGIWLTAGVPLESWRLPFAIGLALYTVPSPADIRGALGNPRQAEVTATGGDEQ